jgi:hypothetical protein
MLRQAHENGMSQEQIGKLIGRSRDSVHGQIRKLGLAQPPLKAVPDRRKADTQSRAPEVTLPPLASLSNQDDDHSGPHTVVSSDSAPASAPAVRALLEQNWPEVA